MRRMYSENQLENQTLELLNSGKVPSIKSDSIIENMSGYSFTQLTPADFEQNYIYAGACKNGNKLTLVLALTMKKTDNAAPSSRALGSFTVPSDIYDKIYPFSIGGADLVATGKTTASNNYNSNTDCNYWLQKSVNNTINFSLNANSMTLNILYYVRLEITILLSENLIS